MPTPHTPAHPFRRTAYAVFGVVTLAAAQPFASSALAQPSAYSSALKVLAVEKASMEHLNSADIVQTSSPAGVTSQVTFSTNMPSQALGSFLAYALAGKPSKSTLTIASVDLNSNKVVSGAVLQTRVQEIDLPVANATSQNGTSFIVKLFPAVSKDLPATLATTSLSPNIRPLIQNAFKVTIDQVNGTGVASVSPIIVSFPGTEQGVGAPRVSPIVISVMQAKMADFQSWMTSGTVRNGTIEFMMPNLQTKLVTIELKGMKIKRIATSTSSPLRSDVSISVSSVRVAEWKD